MLPLARLALARGYRVMGSDAKLDPTSIQKMKEEGLEAFGPPDANRILQIKGGTVVYSTAISEEHPERKAASDRASAGAIRLLHRMDFLNELVQHCSLRLGMAGTHGKTSSTALAGWMLMELQKDPLIIAGGRPLYLERSIRNGPDIAVFETDESDGSFLRSNATHRLILNVDEDHLNHYGSFGELQKAFRRFADQGICVVNYGDPSLAPLAVSPAEVASDLSFSVSEGESSEKDSGAGSAVADLPQHSAISGYQICASRQQCDDSPALFAGYFPEQNDTLHFRIRSISGSYPSDSGPSDSPGNPGLAPAVGSLAQIPAAGSASSSDAASNTSENVSVYYSFRMKVPGVHFASNALGVLTLIYLAFPGIDMEQCIMALEGFPGTERRLELLGQYRGFPVYDDYGHHPSEIRAVLLALKQRFPGSPIVVVFQPHRYTRTAELASAFADSLSQADRVFLLPLYSAGEKPMEGVDSSLIAQHMPAHCPATLLDDDLDQVFDLSHFSHSVQSEDNRNSQRSGNSDAASHPVDAIESEEFSRPMPTVLFLGAGDVSARARRLFARQ